MVYWADYSAGKLSAATLKAAGYTGVIRYIDHPDSLGRKHTSLAEYRDHVANGLTVWLVFERGTNDPLSGFSGGQTNARRAVAGANLLGYSGPIFMCCDRWFAKAGEPTITGAVWRAYLDGAASVLGKGRLGAYGFADAMDAALGHGSYFWQAGSRRAVRPHVHLWQDNTTQPLVGGILTDRNLVLKEEILKGVPPMAAIEWDEEYTFGRTGLKTAFGNFIGETNAAANDASRAAAKALSEVSAMRADVADMKAKLDTLAANSVTLTATGEIVVRPE